MSAPDLGRIGIWSMELRFGDSGASNKAAAELDEMGYGALWIPGGIDGEVLSDVDRLLAATKRAVIATGILNIWKHEPGDVARWFNGLSDAHKGRVMIGIGISHGPIIGENWDKPLARTRAFLDELASAGMAMENTCLAALGPKMVALSGEKTAGAHPYLVSPEHSAQAREILGSGKLLMPEQGVVLEDDPAKAREMAVGALDHYRFLPNYRNNWKRLGFTEEEIENLDDRLLAGLFSMGGVEETGARVKAHLDAGADHVCMQVIGGATGGDFAVQLPRWRRLAEALL